MVSIRRAMLLVAPMLMVALPAPSPAEPPMPNASPAYMDVLHAEGSAWQATGTIRVEGQSVRLAIIEDVQSGSAVTVREGSRVFDGVRVEAVHREFVALRVDGEPVRLRVGWGGAAPVRRSGSALPAVALERKGPARFAVGYHDYRSLLDAVSGYADGNVIRGVRRPGGDHLLELRTVPAASILDRLGLEAGDVILAMQGEAVSGLAHADAVLQAINPGSTLHVVYERAASIRQLSIEVTPDVRDQ